MFLHANGNLLTDIELMGRECPTKFCNTCKIVRACVRA